MSRKPSPRWGSLTFCLIIAQLCVSAPAAAQEDEKAEETPEKWSIEEIHGPPLPFEITLEEGTWMSVDVSPDGQTLVFDLLGNLHALLITGGEATAISSGPAYDQQPRFSPDGSRIVYISDKSGSNQVWIADVDGSNAEARTSAANAQFTSPEWTPDGKYLLALRHDDLAQGFTYDLYMYHVDGGSGVKVVDKAEAPAGPVASPDGRWIYFNSAGFQNSTIERFDRETGESYALAAGYGGAVRPAVSPDGRWLTYGRRFDAEQRLVLRDLQTGAERVLDLLLDRDQQEGFGDGDVLPGYSFTPDGTGIVYSAHGKIRRYDLGTDTSSVIPFRARFEQTLTGKVHFDREIEDGPVRLKLLRWTHQSPDGRTLYFNAAGKNYRYDVATGRGAPIADGPTMEYSPAISPDGRWLAYSTWSDSEGGQIYKVPVDGGSPMQLTATAGHYEHLAWSPDGTRLTFLRYTGGAFRGESTLEEPLQVEIHWLDATRQGETHFVTPLRPRGTRRQTVRPVFNPEGDRIYYGETIERQGFVPEDNHLTSIRLDGTDRRRHLEFRLADDVIPSPDGRWVAFTEQFEVYLTPLPQAGGDPVPVRLEDGQIPVYKLSDEGGYFVNWADGGESITWGWGPSFYRISVEDGVNGDEDAEPEEIAIEVAEPRALATGQVLLTGARIITMGDAGVIERGDILVNGHRIEAVGRSGEVQAPSSARVIDVSGKTIMPGLIDVHAHHLSGFDTEILPEEDWQYVTQLAYGVTTIHNPSARAQAVFTQAEMIETGEYLGPRVYSSGDIIWLIEAAMARPVTDLDDARMQVRRLKALGATSIKQYLQPRREQRQWVVQAAREEGLMVLPEGGGRTFHDMTLVMDGHTSIEHAIPTAPLYQDMRSLISHAGTYYVPTLMVGYGGPAAEAYFYQMNDVYEDEKLLTFTPYAEVASRARRRQMAPMEDYHFMSISKTAAEILKEGGNVALGAHGNRQGLGAHWELWALAMGGLSNMDALRTATTIPAESMGFDRDIGTLEPGKLADLLVLDENPLDDIRNTNTIRYVMKNGFLREGDTMDQIWPERREFPGFHWERYQTWRKEEIP